MNNPWDRTRVPGGSRGGSAAAVAARLAPAATGTDTGGSIRQPAALSGITGIKPTYGVVSRYGMIAFASSLDQAGPMAQSAEDCALMLNAMAGFDARDSTSLRAAGRGLHARTRSAWRSRQPLAGLRIGVPKEFSAPAWRSDVAAAVEAALVEFEKLGAQRVDVSLPNTGLSMPAYYVIAPAEASQQPVALRRRALRPSRPRNMPICSTCTRRAAPQGFGAEVKRRILIGTYVLSHGYYDAYYLQAQKIRRLIADDFAAALQAVRPDHRADLAQRGLRRSATRRRSGADVPDRHLHRRGEPRRPARHVDSLRLRRGRHAGRTAADRQLFRRGAACSHAAHQYQQATDWHLRQPAGRLRDSASTVHWEIVIGLETHAAAVTRFEDLFRRGDRASAPRPTRRPARWTSRCPGVLPVLNRGAVERAIRFGLAVGGRVTAAARYSRARTTSIPTCPRATRSASSRLPVVHGRRHQHSSTADGEKSPCGSRARTWRRTPARSCTRTSTA